MLDFCSRQCYIVMQKTCTIPLIYYALRTKAAFSVIFFQRFTCPWVQSEQLIINALLLTYSRRKYQIESSCSLNRSFQFYSSSLKLMKFDFACYCFLIVKVKKITYIYLFHWSIINPYQWKKCFARRLIDCFFFIYKDNELIFTAIVKYNEILHI